MADDSPSHLQRLNPEQHRAVTATDGPVMVLAGAGSGKTRVLTRRIAHLLHLGVDPEQILAVTFTNKAATEMKERVVELVGEVGDKVWVSTFHSTCGRILRQDIEALGFTKRFSIYDDDDQLRIVRQLLADRGWDPKQFPPGRFLGRIDNYKNRLLTPDDVIEQRRSSPADPVLQLWRDYEENLAAADAIDFNDLIGKVVQLFDESDEIRQKWQEQFRYVLVDEYQDTNHAQYKVLRTLTALNRNLCCVGDDDQSIYGFRGADIRNILDFQSDFPDALIIRMEQNYRCSKNILTVANAVVARNSGRIEKALWTEAHPGPLVNALVAETPEKEAELVATAIKQLLRQEFRYEDMVVLYRSNRTAKTFERALGRAGIPHEVIGGQSFYQRREIRDALAYLRLVVNPADDAAFMRVCNVPARGIGTATLSQVREEAGTRGEPLLATARALAQGSSQSAKALATFVTLIDQLSGLARDLKPPALVREMLDRSGYDDMLLAEDSNEARERAKNLDDLVSRAGQALGEAGQNPLDALQAWLDDVALTATGDDDEEPTGKVSLMTVHTSKGLEFPVVFVVHMMEGTFPHARALEDATVEEERRLAYVAFTRAQKRLVITRSYRLPGTRPGSGEPAQPSRFLYGLPDAATVGELPDTGEGEPDDLEAARRLARRQRLHRFLERRKAAEVDHGSLITREVQSLEDLAPGTRVLHPHHGVGVVRMVVQTPYPPRAKVTFGGHRTETVPLAPCPLVVVVHAEPADPPEDAIEP